LVEGTTALPILGPTRVRLVAQPVEDPPVRAELLPTNETQLIRLLETILPWLDGTNDVFNWIETASVQWEMPKVGALDVRLSLAGVYETNLAGISLRMSLDNGRLRFDSAASDVELTGRIALGDIDSELLVQVETVRSAQARGWPSSTCAHSLPCSACPYLPSQDLTFSIGRSTSLR